jgi:hypothetical protein
MTAAELLAEFERAHPIDRERFADAIRAECVSTKALVAELWERYESDDYSVVLEACKAIVKEEQERTEDLVVDRGRVVPAEAAA